LAAGAYFTVPLALIVAVPWAGWVTDATVSGSPSGSPSLPSTATLTEPSSATVAVSATAVGASLTSVTVIVTVAVALFGSATPLVVPLSVTV